MDDKNFSRLLDSVKQFVKIKEKKMPPSRIFEFSSNEVKNLRESLNKSQTEFAKLLGVSVSTLRNWEQGRRKPMGPAQALLKLVKLQPQLVLNSLSV
ncbi:MAG: helix-turn-helix domain-containing protein [Candidatus Riflebacteria bacterium]|nr:helix-turn-helix domain-containing protein [Candidatus Riflebacteria bacterium]